MASKPAADHLKALPPNALKDLKLNPVVLATEKVPIYQFEKWRKRRIFSDNVLDADCLLNSPKSHGFNLNKRVTEATETPNTVDGITVIEPLQLFNLMMAREHGAHPKVADPNYMLLLGVVYTLLN